MGRRMIKEGTIGQKTAYLSRAKACKKLQLSLRDFRRLTILKGIHPVEPRCKKKVNPSCNLRTFYYLKDIQLMAHDPLIDKFRNLKSVFKKVSKAKGKKEMETVKRLRANIPNFDLKYLVKERYPTFDLALRDLGDALSLISCYTTFPTTHHVPLKFIQRSQRLITEFLLCVIQMRALRKGFVTAHSGVWYEASIKGTPVVWQLPIVRGVRYEEEIDVNVMTTFTEIWLELVEHVNCYLYKKMNLCYPPALAAKEEDLPLDDHLLAAGEELEVEQVASLAHPLKGAQGFSKEEQEQLDPDMYMDDDEFQRHKEEMERTSRLQTLFENCKFFISRGADLLHLVFIIRSLGGQVSWERTMGPGATYAENDPGITHQIVERPSVGETYPNRVYIQSLWLFDTLNHAALMPSHEYRVGVIPPPLLSPFVEEKPGEYVPPEREEKLQLLRGEMRRSGKEYAKLEAAEMEPDQVEEESEEESSEDEEVVALKKKPEPQEEEKKMKKKPRKKTAKDKEEDVKAENKRLAEMMMSKKHKKLYEKIKYSKKQTSKMANRLRNKRMAIDAAKSASA